MNIHRQTLGKDLASPSKHIASPSQAQANPLRLPRVWLERELYESDTCEGRRKGDVVHLKSADFDLKIPDKWKAYQN